MAVEFLVNRLKALIVLLLGVFRRAMCCLRRRRRSSCDSIPLSTIGVVPNTVNNTTQPVSFEHYHSPFFKFISFAMIQKLWKSCCTIDSDNSNHWRCLLKELEHWDQWEENPVVVVPDKPVNTVQAKIEQYRQQVSKLPESTEEQQPNFFEVIISIALTTGKYLYLTSYIYHRIWHQRLQHRQRF